MFSCLDLVVLVDDEMMVDLVGVVSFFRGSTGLIGGVEDRINFQEYNPKNLQGDMFSSTATLDYLLTCSYIRHNNNSFFIYNLNRE